MLTDKETGRLTLTMFNKLYGHYKDNWDMEMRMFHNNMTYRGLYLKSQEDDEWF